MAEQTSVKKEAVAKKEDDVIVAGGTPQGEAKAKAGGIEIVIDLDLLTIGDLEILDRAKDGNLPMKEMISFLDRVVEGGVRHLSVKYFSPIIDQLGDAIAESSNPGN